MIGLLLLWRHTWHFHVVMGGVRKPLAVAGIWVCDAIKLREGHLCRDFPKGKTLSGAGVRFLVLCSSRWQAARSKGLSVHHGPSWETGPPSAETESCMQPETALLGLAFMKTSLLSAVRSTAKRSEGKVASSFLTVDRCVRTVLSCSA